MSTAKDLELRVQQLEELLRRVGMPMPSEVSADPTTRPDYIEPGSAHHLAWLGLVKLAHSELDNLAGFDTFQGTTGVVYRLVDPIGPYGGYNDPKQAAMLALRQKVAVFEAGTPPVHDKAPEMWYPKDEMPELARLMRR